MIEAVCLSGKVCDADGYVHAYSVAAAVAPAGASAAVLASDACLL